jgi:hypothetical protein
MSSVDKRDQEREQARLRQARKRRRDFEARLDVRAIAIADQMPPSWRKDWLKRVKRNREGKERASVEVNKAAASIPNEHRADFLAGHRQNTKFSLAELRNRFVREKEKARKTDAPTQDQYSGGGERGVWQDSRGWGLWGDRYPGSPPIEFVRWIAEVMPRPPRKGRGMAWQRAERLLAAACVCHDASVTSRPEYWLVANRPPVRIFVR